MTGTNTKEVPRWSLNAQLDVAGTAMSLHPLRLIASLILGFVIIRWIYDGPPVGSIGEFDLRFGLQGPIAQDPWKWMGALLLVALVIGVERLKLTALLIKRPTARDLEWVLYAFGAVMVWSWLASIFAPQGDNQGVATIARLGVAGVIVLIITAAVTEEIVYRGYLAERLGAVFGKRAWARWVGVALSLTIFVVPHVAFFDPSWLVHQLPGAIAIALIAALRRNLIAAMLLHLLVNLPILIPTVAALSS